MWIKEKIALILVFVCFLMLGGCIGKSDKTNNYEKAQNSKQQETIDYQFLEYNDSPWEDNKVDELHAVINLPIKKVAAEGELNGGKANNFVGECGCVRFKNHIYNFYKDGWSGVNGVTIEGEEFSGKVEVDPEHADAGNQIFELGPVSGKKEYVACYYKFNKFGKVDEYWFYHLDDNFQSIRRIQANMKTDEILESMMGDTKGNYHLTYIRTGGKYSYSIISPEGEEIFETNLEHSARLCAYGEGKVALCNEQIYDNKPKEKKFYKYDFEKKEFMELPVSKDESVQKKMSGFVYVAVPASENALAWCGRDGIYVYDSHNKVTQKVYNWSSHGMNPSMVHDLNVTSDGNFEIIYEDAEGLSFIFLKPTKEKEELKSITIAVSPNNKENYLSMAAYFHKHYPAYVVNIKDDYDEVSLLTQLGAGEGPVLIDTELTGFDSLEKLWQPLDGFYEQTGYREKIYPEVLDLGKIGDITYGIVRNFKIETLLVADKGPIDWDYDEFLNVLDSFGGAALTNGNTEATFDWREKYFDIINNSFDDSYFLNSATGEMLFGDNAFERVLKISDKAKKCPPSEDGNALLEGRALCEYYEITGLWDILRLHRRIEKNGERVIGYPTTNGARHLLVAQAPIVMRATATEEEKRIGYTFLKYMLSDEAMMLPTNGYLSVRKDVLDYQLDNFEKTVESMKESGIFDPGAIPELYRDEDVAFFEGLILNSKVRKSFPVGLQQIFDEEFGDYLSEMINDKILVDHLKSRVWLFLEESK